VLQPVSGDGGVSHVGGGSHRQSVLLGGAILSLNSNNLAVGQVNARHGVDVVSVAFLGHIGTIGGKSSIVNRGSGALSQPQSNILVDAVGDFSVGQVGHDGAGIIVHISNGAVHNRAHNSGGGGLLQLDFQSVILG